MSVKSQAQRQVRAKFVSRDEQKSVILRALGLSLINEQFARYVDAVMRLAVMAFDDNACLRDGSINAIGGWKPLEWAILKGELELAVKQSGLPPLAQAEWLMAFEAVYRIAGSDDIEPDYRGVF
ncbi:hypothetical protein [Methylobacterium dankookense]|uniref:Uncharacterized protein n=1 Tax=Methylobacterium dankookense TaxID=560405 RepID=A0A564G839_9HYPH|nr:hypothetical protein [Methylobacterium dankookense]GJD57231.1 hypothetical protein IFDJLNFL_3132 [Methylobacterium dankookense]VUF15701.1 hypothetical protein MTDSW087_05445 [Methylobacterium dankookense]